MAEQSADLRSAYTVARDALWDCYSLTGADVSGDVGRSVTAWAAYAVEEVARQRAELDLALDALQDIYAAGIEHPGLRAQAWKALNYDPPAPTPEEEGK